MASIFHLVRRGDLKAWSHEGLYAPPSLAKEGFVHCAGDVRVALEVADSYFRDGEEPVLLLEVELGKLGGAECRFEPPAPLTGSTLGQRHHAPGRLFPHVYGPLPLESVRAAYVLVREGEEGFVLGRGPAPLSALLADDTHP